MRPRGFIRWPKHFAIGICANYDPETDMFFGGKKFSFVWGWQESPDTGPARYTKGFEIVLPRLHWVKDLERRRVVRHGGQWGRSSGEWLV